MLDKLGWCARNPPALLGGGMASSSSRRRPHGPCRRRSPFRFHETDFATPAELPTKPHLNNPQLPYCRQALTVEKSPCSLLLLVFPRGTSSCAPSRGLCQG